VRWEYAEYAVTESKETIEDPIRIDFGFDVVISFGVVSFESKLEESL